jgi:hypothetical protein
VSGDSHPSCHFSTSGLRMPRSSGSAALRIVTTCASTSTLLLNPAAHTANVHQLQGLVTYISFRLARFRGHVGLQSTYKMLLMLKPACTLRRSLLQREHC